MAQLTFSERGHGAHLDDVRAAARGPGHTRPVPRCRLEGDLDIAAYGQVKRSRDDGGWDVVYQSDDFHGPDAGWGYPSAYMRQAFARQVQDLTNAIADGSPMEVSAEDGLKAIEMVEAVTRVRGNRSDRDVAPRRSQLTVRTRATP